MKLALITFLCMLVGFVVCQPLEQSPVSASADSAAVKFLESEAEITHDLEGSEDLLKIVYKKLDHWIKKCVKLGGCYGYGDYDDYGHSSYGHSSYGHSSYGHSPYGSYGGPYGGHRPSYGGYGYGGSY